MIKITVADQIRAPGQDWVITSKYWAELARCDYMFVTGECHAVTRHVSRVTLSQLSQLFGTHQLFSHSLSLHRVTLCLGNILGKQCSHPKQGTDERAALGNVWVIRFNKSETKSRVMLHLYFAAVSSTGSFGCWTPDSVSDGWMLFISPSIVC